MVEGNDSYNNEALSQLRPARQKKPYILPELIDYSNVAQLTAGAGGTHFDPGHATRIKCGHG
jgi:hypothetical protein